MKVVIQDGNNFVLSFSKGEEVISELNNFLKTSKITACSFSGIGACSSVELGFFNIHIKDYRKKPFLEEMEIVSLNGNGGVKDGEPVIHTHGVFGKTDFTLIGGHVFKVVVSVTCEIYLTKLGGQLTRVNNSDYNLNLLS